MKSDKGKKFAAGVLVFVAITLVLYIIQFSYFDKTDVLETEYALDFTQEDIITVQGYAVRDEYRQQDGVNTSILLKNSNKIYVPVIEESSSVAVNDVLAVSFDGEEQADAYIRIEELKEKKEELEHLKSLEGLSKISVSYLNSQTYKAVQEYVACLCNGEFENLENISGEFCNSVTSKQIATGYDYDFDVLINDCEDKITSLESLVGQRDYITSPYAGYFVSSVDGYEQNKSYSDVVDKVIAPGEAAVLRSAAACETGNTYGKIIAQHTWFLLCDFSIEQTSDIKIGKTVYVDFPEKKIYDIPMSVYDISDMKDEIVTVTFKCKYLNDELAVLRNEKVSVTVAEYSGFKISNTSLVKNEEGIDGVYVLAGNVARFTPVKIIYYAENYVVAEKYVAYTIDSDGNKIVDEEKTASYRELKRYDSIIVKGTNIEDGKVIT